MNFNICILVILLSIFVSKVKLYNTVNEFPQTETLNRNQADLEKQTQEHNVQVVRIGSQFNNTDGLVNEFPNVSQERSFKYVPKKLPSYCQNDLACQIVDSRVRRSSKQRYEVIFLHFINAFLYWFFFLSKI